MTMHEQLLPPLLLCLASSAGQCAKLQPATIAAWEHYIQDAAAAMKARALDPDRFLWIDELPGGPARARQGEILASPARPTGATMTVPGGMVNHWVGAVFVPGVSLNEVIPLLNDFDRYAVYFGPTVVHSKLIYRDAERSQFSMRWQKRAYGITATVDTEWEGTLAPVNETRWYGLNWSTSVREVRNPGRLDEERLPPGEGGGYIWRTYGITRYAQRDGGVYVEMEALVLSRDIPAALRWLLTPFVRRLSRGSILTSLRQAREALAAGVAPGVSEFGKLSTD